MDRCKRPRFYCAFELPTYGQAMDKLWPSHGQLWLPPWLFLAGGPVSELTIARTIEENPK